MKSFDSLLQYFLAILLAKKDMTKLAISSGTVIYEEGNKLFICKRPGTWIPVFLFVTGLLAIILLINGILQLITLGNQSTGSSTAGIIFILIAVVITIIFWRVKIVQKKINTVPLNELKNIAIIDFNKNRLLDAQQNMLSPVNQTYLLRKMQLSSSSPELMLCWNNGSVSIVKGNPFAGGIAKIEKVLLAKGIVKK